MPPRFQIKGKTFLLTYPKCDMNIDAMSEEIKKSVGDYFAFCVVSAEKHQDGSDHRHVYLVLKEICRFTSARCFDINGQHGDYKSVKNSNKDRERALKYAQKDGNYVILGTDDLGLKLHLESPKKQSLDETVAKRILQGDTLESLVTEHPAYFIRNLKKAKEFESFVTMIGDTAPPNRFLSVTVSPCACPGCIMVDSEQHVQDCLVAYSICDWFNDRISRHTDDPLSIAIREPQLWIVSPPGAGKTTFVSKLMDCLSIFDIPKTEDFYDNFRNNRYDLAVLDEYHGQKQVSWLNSFLDGSKLTLRIKGGQYIKNDRLPTIILSNEMPRDVYSTALSKNHKILDPMLDDPARVKVVEANAAIMHMLFITSVARAEKRPLSPEIEAEPHPMSDVEGGEEDSLGCNLEVLGEYSD